MEAADLISPPRDSFWVEEVRKVHGTWPNLSQERFTLILDEYIVGHATLVHAIGAIDADSRINDDYVLHAYAVNFFQERQELGTRVVRGVKGEILVAIHVIVVVPDHVKRDLSLFVALNDVFNH